METFEYLKMEKMYNFINEYKKALNIEWDEAVFTIKQILKNDNR